MIINLKLKYGLKCDLQSIWTNSQIRFAAKLIPYFHQAGLTAIDQIR